MLRAFEDLAAHERERYELSHAELRPFNDAQLNRDLNALCARVAPAQPRLQPAVVVALSRSG